jgi:VWFA-related protein
MWRTPIKVYKQIALAAILTAMAFSPPVAGRSADDGSWSIYASVEQDGKLVTGLKPDNFRVSIDNRSQPFGLELAETPISIVLLVEYSQQSWRYLTDIQNAIDGFAEHAPEDNWYALVTFDHAINVAVDFTKEKGQISSGFSQLGQPMWDEIDTYDAICDTVDKMARLPGRRAIVFIGLGLDTFSRRSMGDVQKTLEAANVTVYGLGAGSAFRSYYQPYLGTSASLDLAQAQAFLTMLAGKTGGYAWFPSMDIGFRDAMKGVMQDLSMQYRIVLKGNLPSDGRVHKVKVEAFTVAGDKWKGLKVRVRDSIRAPLT